MTARPEKTQLLANYPNPFNPETWIPYELATDTNVRLTIYNTQGVVIRSLQLGHQSAGYYTGRDRAAYWDGRNALGEQVASGLYFYQLETDTMSLTAEDGYFEIVFSFQLLVGEFGKPRQRGNNERRRGVKAAPFLYCIEISCQRSVLRQKDRSQVSGRRLER